MHNKNMQRPTLRRYWSNLEEISIGKGMLELKFLNNIT